MHTDWKATEKMLQNGIVKRASQAVITSNINNTMSSLSVINQQSTTLVKERKSIDVIKKTNIMSNLIYKPLDASALATKA